jgi:hypothetical protein
MSDSDAVVSIEVLYHGTRYAIKRTVKGIDWSFSDELLSMEVLRTADEMARAISGQAQGKGCDDE